MLDKASLTDLVWMAAAEICRDYDQGCYHYDSGHRHALRLAIDSLSTETKVAILTTYPKMESFWNEHEGYPKGTFCWAMGKYHKK